MGARRSSAIPAGSAIPPLASRARMARSWGWSSRSWNSEDMASSSWICAAIPRRSASLGCVVISLIASLRSSSRSWRRSPVSGTATSPPPEVLRARSASNRMAWVDGHVRYRVCLPTPAWAAMPSIVNAPAPRSTTRDIAASCTRAMVRGRAIGTMYQTRRSVFIVVSLST